MIKDVNNRLKQFIDYKELSIRAFERELEVSAGSIAKPIREGTSWGVDTLIKIINTYSLNPEWLFTGQGEMLLNGKTAKHITNSFNNGINGDITHHATTEYSKLVDEVVFLRNELQEKNHQLKEKDSFIHKLLDKLK